MEAGHGWDGRAGYIAPPMSLDHLQRSDSQEKSYSRSDRMSLDYKQHWMLVEVEVKAHHFWRGVGGDAILAATSRTAAEVGRT